MVAYPYPSLVATYHFGGDASITGNSWDLSSGNETGYNGNWYSRYENGNGNWYFWHSNTNTGNGTGTWVMTTHSVAQNNVVIGDKLGNGNAPQC